MNETGSSERPERPATDRDVRRAMWTVVVAIGVSTILIILTLRNVFPGL